jgi:tetraacyldisaccharide 4'-kinase
VVLNVGHGSAPHPSLERIPAGISRFAMRLEGATFRNVLDPGRRVGAEHFRGKRAHAVAGIGHPGRFFARLRALGVEFTSHPFPDHHPFAASDLDFAGADAVLMTEKDGVKCRRFARDAHWELVVDAVLDDALLEQVLRKLKSRG